MELMATKFFLSIIFYIEIESQELEKKILPTLSHFPGESSNFLPQNFFIDKF